MLVSRGSARIHQFPPQKRDVAPGSGIEQASVVFRRDAAPLVPPMDNDDRKTKVTRQRLAAWPLVDNGSDGVFVLHAPH